MTTERTEEPRANGEQADAERRIAAQVEAYFDENAEAFHTASQRSPLWHVARQVALDNAGRFLPGDPEGRAAFVAGIGGGWHARRLAEAGWEVTLADVSQKMIELYDEDLEGIGCADRISLRKVDFCEMPAVRSRGYHAVLLVGGVLSDYARPEKALREVVRISASGAVLALSAKNKYASYTSGATQQHLAELKVLMEEGIRGWAKGYRPRLFSPEELIGLLSIHRVDVKRAISYPHFFNPAEPAGEGGPSSLDEELIEEYLALEQRYAAIPSLLGKGPILDLLGVKKPDASDN